MNYELLGTAGVYGGTLAALAAKNNDIFVVEADLMKASGSKIFKDRFPDRHLNVGVAEQNLVGVAAGLASMGRIPFACTMSNFMSQRACDQVTISVSYSKLNVKLVGCLAGLSQEKNGGTHVSIMDIAIMRCLPNLKIIVPSDLKELNQSLIFAASDDGPTYIRMSRYLPESIFDSSYKFDIGQGYQINDGKDLTLISTGITTHIALEALQELKKEGISARLIHFSTIKPIDEDLILKCAKETGAIITIEDHSTSGGLGSLVAEIVSENFPVPVYRIGMKDTFGLTAMIDFQLKYFGISVENIIKKSKEIIK